jgi:hypothetical protein
MSSIGSPNFLQEILGKAKLDLKSIAMIGHSFGGITSLQVGLNSQKFKACVSLDPWFLACEKQVNDKRFFVDKKTPQTLVVYSPTLPELVTKLSKDFDQKACMDTFSAESQKAGRFEQVTINDSLHDSMSDKGYLFPTEICTERFPHPRYMEINYHVNYLVVDFLARTGIIGDAKGIEAKLDQTLLKYDAKLK